MVNGKEVFKFDGERTLEKDTDRMPVTLVKGQNVLVLKIGNVVNNWQACARFLRNRRAGDRPRDRGRAGGEMRCDAGLQV